MATHGLRIWGASGALQFDSGDATGGVCLGFYTVPSGGGTASFPDMVGVSGIVLNAWAGAPIDPASITSDSAPGYLRFNFHPSLAGQVYALFAK